MYYITYNTSKFNKTFGEVIWPITISYYNYTNNWMHKLEI